MMYRQILNIFLLLLCPLEISGFSVSPQATSSSNLATMKGNISKPTTWFPTKLAAGAETDDDAVLVDKKKSLEEKMASWEASEEEIKAASLGGLTPGKGATDGFDIGLYIAFPIIVATSLFFAVFPFIMDKIDTSSVGPPPTV